MLTRKMKFQMLVPIMKGAGSETPEGLQPDDSDSSQKTFTKLGSWKPEDERKIRKLTNPRIPKGVHKMGGRLI